MVTRLVGLQDWNGEVPTSEWYGYNNLGTPYSMTTLTSMQQEVVEEIAQLGFVLTQKGRHDQWFIPTHLAAALSSSLSESATSDSEGFIVVETNFRVYAYTQSKLQAEILSLFMRLEYRLPNLVVGIMNRETVNNALALGIVAEQVGSPGGLSRAGGSSGGFSRAGGSSGGFSTAGGSSGGFSRAGGSSGGFSRAGGSSGGFSRAGGSSGGFSRAGGSSGGFSRAGGSSGGFSRAGGSSGSFSRAGGSSDSAVQIVQYMRKNAHPLVATKPPVVPETVVDQVLCAGAMCATIRLWEFDRNRVATTAAVLYDDFPTQEVFEAIVKHAQQIGALLWKDSKKRKFVVRVDAHDSVRTFIRHLGSKKKRRSDA
ncbi:unnamed protein product [Closterium sp. NIES-65]|nr:unnamed protein product [Closterium sp. NIES-65]